MAKTRKSFIFCVHAHQPVGNFGGVFEEAYEKCYRPFFEVLAAHPRFPMVCHFSGSLLDWLEARRPEFLRSLRRLGQAGQIEFMGGAYYEPIYGLIPQNDLTGQISLMREKVDALFGQKPRGAWLTERVWDPGLVRPLKKTGVEYTVLDDTHFEKANLPQPSSGYYRTREGWHSLDLFASQRALRYLMPFRRPEDTLEYLHALEVPKGQAIVFADDCEKFGLWPGTHDWVYGQRWLDRFLTLIENDRSIEPQTFSKFRSTRASRGNLRVPHASYSEMMQWSGGRFYNFFEKYPESRYMKERMRNLSARLARSRLNGKEKKAKLALYKAQCNCSYWHGIFGGLYLHHLRSSVYENLICADGLMNGHERLPHVSVETYEDGKRGVLRQEKIVSYFNPGYGAALEELDYVPRPANLVCTIQRRPESYHALTASNGASAGSGDVSSLHQMLGTKEKNLAQALCYDPFRRLCFLDHFFSQAIGLREFNRSGYEDIGDFADAHWRALFGKDRMTFERRGSLELLEGRTPLLVRKEVRASGAGALETAYSLENRGRLPVRFVFACEFNFSIGAEEALRGLELHGVKERVFRDSWRGISIRFSADAEGSLLATPVETVSGSEGGLEKTYQQLAVLFQKEFSLGPSERRSLKMGLEVMG